MRGRGHPVLVFPIRHRLVTLHDSLLESSERLAGATLRAANMVLLRVAHQLKDSGP